MIYAPILIPTLNRIEHLQKCIASLQKNTWAQFTPLIISVDYPPESRYREGYQKVCEYLKKGIMGFASVDIIYHKNNLGPIGNYQFLKDYSKERYDRYIFTEDDNEMSPNFIEYIDKGLELFHHQGNILAICSNGAVDCYEDEKNNIALSHNFSAHGYGTWHDIEVLYQEMITRDHFIAIAKDCNKVLKLYKYDPSLVFALQHAVLRSERLYQLSDGKIPIIDMTIKIYAVLYDQYVVCPKLQKSRNWGYDGSGFNCPEVKLHNAGETKIDQRKEFSYQYTHPIDINRIKKRNSLNTVCRVVAAFVKLQVNIWLKKV